jgi:excisionase family DNA binding protein
MADELLTVLESCAYLRISRSLLFKLMKDKKLKAVRLSQRKVFFTKAELEKFIKRSSPHC